MKMRYSLCALVAMVGLSVLSASPQPANHEVVATAPAVLRWDATPAATHYDVFFGTSRETVGAAERDLPESAGIFLGSAVTPEIAAPALFSPGGVWFWRVDAIAPDTTMKGPVWSYSGRLALVGNFAGPQDSWYKLGRHNASIGRDFAFVGYPEWESNRDGDQISRPGIVQVFRRIPGSDRWEDWQRLTKPPGTAINARFGSAVLLNGTTCWVSAWGDGAGSVFQYKLSADDQWVRTPLHLRSSSTNSSGAERFGSSLTQGDSWVAATVPLASLPTRFQAGAIDIFDVNTGEWQTRLFAPTPKAGEQYGGLLAGEGNTLFNVAADPWRIDVYKRSIAGSWAYTRTLLPPEQAHILKFGQSIAYSGGLLLVGAPSGTDQIPSRVYVFEENPDQSWRVTWIFNPAIPDIYDDTRVALHGNRVALHYRDNANTSSEVQLWQRESDGSWMPLGKTTETGSIEPVTDGAVALALSDRYLVQTGAGFAVPLRVRFFLHDTGANVPPVIRSKPILYGEVGRPYSYNVMAEDQNSGESITVVGENLPPWLSFTPGADGAGVLAGIPPPAGIGDHAIALLAMDSRGAKSSQLFTLKIVSPGGLPVIASFSPNQTINDHHPLTLSVVLEDSGAASYLWFVDGILLANQTSATLSIEHAQASDAGAYTARISRGPVVIESEPIIVSVLQVPDRFGGDWTTFGGSTSHGGRYPATLGNHFFVPSWNKQIADGVMAANQVVTGWGKVYASYTNDRRSPPVLRALNPQNGEEFWATSFPLSADLSAPSFHRGVIYQYRTNAGAEEPDLTAINAADGSVRWVKSSVPSARHLLSYAPAVSDLGIFYFAGGIVSFDTAGVQQWIGPSDANEQSTPLLHRGRLYGWKYSFFEVSLEDGRTFWSLKLPWIPWQDPGVHTVATAEGDVAAVLDSKTLRAIDLTTLAVKWTHAGAFLKASPAIGDGIIYANASGAVHSYHAQSGIELGNYVMQNIFGEPANGIHQPVVLDDRVLVSSYTETWVFDRQSRTLLQRLPAGGPLTYVDGFLFAAGTDGILRTFTLNVPAPPVAPVSLPSPAVVDANSPLNVDVAGFFQDSDPGDILSYSIVANDQPALFSEAEITPLQGQLRLAWAPYTWGTATLTVRATDSYGLFADTTLSVTLPAPPPLELVSQGSTRFNELSGLVEQALVVRNPGSRAVGGFNLWVDAGPDAQLYNGALASTTGPAPTASWVVQSHIPLLPASEIVIVLEFYSANGAAFPILRGADPLNALERTNQGTDRPFGISGVSIAAQGLLLEFPTSPGIQYRVESSEDAVIWTASSLPLRAAGSLVTWMDARSSPAARFYRIQRF